MALKRINKELTDLGRYVYNTSTEQVLLVGRIEAGLKERTATTSYTIASPSLTLKQRSTVFMFCRTYWR
jgi:hypothetical protein